VRTICAVVLVFEAIVIGLAIPVATNLQDMGIAVAGGLWGGMAVAALVLSGLQKRTWAHYAGWALQAAFLLSSFWVSGMLLFAVVFVSLWVTGVVMGRRVDEARAAHSAAVHAQEASASGTGSPQTR